LPCFEAFNSKRRQIPTPKALTAWHLDDDVYYRVSVGDTELDWEVHEDQRWDVARIGGNFGDGDSGTNDSTMIARLGLFYGSTCP
jgi:hypothetical protein